MECTKIAVEPKKKEDSKAIGIGTS